MSNLGAEIVSCSCLQSHMEFYTQFRIVLLQWIAQLKWKYNKGRFSLYKSGGRGTTGSSAA